MTARPSAGSTKFVPFGPRHAKHGLVFLHGWKMNGSSMRSCVRAALGESALAHTIVYFMTAPLTKDDDGIEKSCSTSTDPPAILRDVPLWRVQWTELPGMQNVLNVWQPHYTNMFMKIVNGPRPWYFGHLFLPGGTESLNKTEYYLHEGSRAPRTGEEEDSSAQLDATLPLLA